MRISELKKAIREMIVSELNEVDMGQVTTDDSTKAAELARKGINVLIPEDEALSEMAFLKGPRAPEGLEAAITAVVKSNSDAELVDIRKAIKTDEKVLSALKKVGIKDVRDGIADNQLNKFIELIRGNRVIGKLGRPVDPNKPAKEPKEKGSIGRPKGSTKPKDSVAFTMGGNVSISGKNVSPAEKKKAVKSAALNKPVELLKIKDMAVIDKEIIDLSGELKSKVAPAKQIASKGNTENYTEEEVIFMDDMRAKSQRLTQLKATREKLQTKTIKRQDRNIDIASTDED
jgi:hypothetical protein